MPPIGNVTCQPNNVTTEDPSNIGKDDLNALLYIVVTLLFYSMGIIIGIITYLKREQADMEEDKMFDMYMQLKREPFNLYKRERVQQMALYLKQLEEQSAAREKIENWKTIEHSQMQAHIQRFQPCRRHTHRHFSCPDCSKTSPIAEMGQGHDDKNVLDAGWAENGGGTALLCSLTLGVCEPLLTPDSMKRFALTDPATAEGKPVSSSSHSVPMLQSHPSVHAKTAFRNNSLAVHTAGNDPSFSRDHHPANELKQSLLKSHPPDITLDSSSMFERCDMELKELRQFKYDEVKAVFQKNSALEECNGDVCDNVTSNALSTSPRSNKRSASLTTKTGTCSALHQQLSQNPDRKSCDLTVHSALGKTYNLHPDIYNENMTTSVESPLDDSVTSPDVHNHVTSVDRLKENILHYDVSGTDIPKGMLQLQLNSNDAYLEQEHRYQQLHPLSNDAYLEQKHRYQQLHPLSNDAYLEQEHRYQQLHPLGTSSTAVPETTPISQVPQKYEIPLHLFVLTPQPVQSIDVRPKVFFPMQIIPSGLFKEESVNPCTNSPKLTSPQTTQSAPLHDSWKPSNSKNVDMSGVTRARQLGLNWKSKTAEKKGAPRTQPERRGALFFTQRSLHKDIEGPKSASGRKQSRPTVFSRQESVDSNNSQASDMSRSLENPLLHYISDLDKAMNLSSPSLSAGSDSISPPAASRHGKRIPRLIRSQTVDTSKLLNQSNPF